MNQDIEAALHLQRIDVQRGELEKELAALPKHIAAIEKQLDSHQRKLEADRAVHAANQKDRRGQETDIQTHQQKISKLRELSPLWEMVQEGVDLSTVQWAAH